MEKRLSLWLIPDAAARAAIAALVRASPSLDRARRELRGAYACCGRGPRGFPPHVTLASGRVTTAPRLGPIVLGIGRFSARIVGVESSPRFFRCVALAVEQGGPLRDLRTRAAIALGAARRDDAPHVSLLYARAGDARRAAIAHELAQPSLGAVGFARVEAWWTHGPVSSWRRASAVSLSSGG